MNEALSILRQYWGFDSFREPQADIIASLVAGKDTLALLPTGGGKSICFQVPAMLKPGICIVISPLIALMKDQVGNLEKARIKAISITSEMNYQQLDAAFDRCIFDDDVKFLYLSPERLHTDLAVERLSRMEVNLIAVDEAHCISEWGYDFRPAYLEIAEIRKLHPNVPLIALTASATLPVVKDIQQKLAFASPHVIRKSFKRENLAYFIDFEEDKLGKIERIAQKQGGSGIVYVRSRVGTERIARILNQRGVSAECYHAGLENAERSARQLAWINDEVQVMVATNAFGMGIDKSDVRFVIHCDIPDTLENYYQECGRGGRDGKRSFAVSLLNQQDIHRFEERMERAFPEKSLIKKVYEIISDHLQLAVGSGKGETFEVDLEHLGLREGIDWADLMQCLRFLEREEYLTLSEQSYQKSTVKITAQHDVVRRVREEDAAPFELLSCLLRSYPRLFDEETVVSEWTLARRLGWNKATVIEHLDWLQKGDYITYLASDGHPRITYQEERLASKNIRLSDEHYRLRKRVVEDKALAMKNYIHSTHKCRSRLILEYFGETDADECGICDTCRKQGKA